MFDIFLTILHSTYYPQNDFSIVLSSFLLSISNDVKTTTPTVPKVIHFVSLQLSTTFSQSFRIYRAEFAGNISRAIFLNAYMAF